MLPLFATLAGGFPLRRTLYGETWSFPVYLAFMFRLLVGVAGFWILLVSTPYLVMGAGELRWVAAAALGLLLALWNRGYSAVLIRLTGARPLADDERFAPFFAAVDERSRVPPPRRYVVPVPGGRLVNAIALPSARQPRVVFTSSLLELLEPDEVGAIYAHEVGHVEYFRGRSLRIVEIVVYLMTAAAVVWSLLPWSGFLPAISWPLLFFILLKQRTRWMRGHETDTDLRAAELCGDADALIRALTRLHQLMLLPRRLALETEWAMSHPSLARRIQAIRAAAGPEAGPETEATGEAEPTSAALKEEADRPPPLFLRTSKAGTSILLEPERISWFEGVAATPPTPEAPPIDALHRAAASSRTLVYGQLAELRLEVRRGKTSLVVIDRQGEKRSFGIANDDVAAVQSRLDAVDARLGTPSGEVVSKAARSWHRVLAAAAALSSVLPPVAGAVSVPALFAVVKPRPVSLVAAGLAGLAACGYRVLQVPVHSAGPELTIVNTWLLGLTSLVLLASGIGWARRAPTVRSQGAWLLAAICWGLTVVHWGVLFFLSGAGGTPDVYRLNWFLYWAPSAFLLPLSAAVALFFVRTRGGRLAFVVAAVLALVPLAATTTAFRDAFVDDPLVPRGPVAPSVARGLEEVARAELDVSGTQLVLSPSGETWAVCVAPGWGFCNSLTWRLGRVDGSPLPAGAEELTGATQLAFVDDERLVLLSQAAAEESAGYGETSLGSVVVRRSLVTGEARPIELPASGNYETHLGVSGESWTVVTFAYRDERHLLCRFTGGWSDDAFEETVWDLGDVEMGWVRGAAGRGDHALAVRTRFNFAAFYARNGTQEVVGLSPAGEERLLVSTRLGLTCDIFPPSEKGLCVARDRGRTFLWRVDPAGREEPEVVGTYRSPGGEVLLPADDGVLILTPYGSPYWLEHDGGPLVVLEWPAERRSGTLAVSGTGLVAELQETASEGGGSVLLIYRPSW